VIDAERRTDREEGREGDSQGKYFMGYILVSYLHVIVGWIL
jgi:hypothetical protein